MPSKRIEKFVIRRRADAVTKERKRLKRVDRALRGDCRSAADVMRVAEDDAADCKPAAMPATRSAAPADRRP